MPSSTCALRHSDTDNNERRAGDFQKANALAEEETAKRQCKVASLRGADLSASNQSQNASAVVAGNLLGSKSLQYDGPCGGDLAYREGPPHWRGR